jgi:predicted DNA-binding transcriptional regulator AlpA
VLLTIPEAAARYGLAESNLYRWLACQGLPGAARLGGRWYLRTAAFERWLAGEAVETPTSSVDTAADSLETLGISASGRGVAHGPPAARPPPARSSRPRGRLPPG